MKQINSLHLFNLIFHFENFTSLKIYELFSILFFFFINNQKYILEPGASILTQVSEKTIEKYPLTINNDSDNIKNIETKFKYNNRRRNNILKRELSKIFI